jgi:hypothetical protein
LNLILFLYRSIEIILSGFRAEDELRNVISSSVLGKRAVAQLVRKIPHLLWNPNVHHPAHIKPPVAPNLRQTSPAHILIFCLFPFPFNIISLVGVVLPADYFPSCSHIEMYAFLLDFHPAALSNFGTAILFF